MTLSLNEKKRITNELYPISFDDAKNDFLELLNLTQKDINNISSYSKIGNKTVNYFTALERLSTIGRKGISFFDLVENKDMYLKKPYVKKLMDYYNDMDELHALTKVMALYYGSIAIFKPIITMKIIQKFECNQGLLDFTMGWGGRLVGCCALQIPHYIGIDLNNHLKIPYKNLVNMIKPHTKTKITLYFKSALNIDYSKLKYDIVFTSPPYYNIELYNNTKKQTKEEWDNNFYIPIFSKTFNHLQPNGHYILNISKDIYERVCIPLFGKCKKRIPLTLSKRFNSDEKQYNEYIYIWVKNNDIIIHKANYK